MLLLADPRMSWLILLLADLMHTIILTRITTWKEWLTSKSAAPTSPQLKLPIFSSGDRHEWQEWKQTFTTIAEHYNWDDNYKRKAMIKAFKGTAEHMARDIIDDLRQEPLYDKRDKPFNIRTLMALYDKKFIWDPIWSAAALEVLQEAKRSRAPWDPEFSQTHGYRRMSPPRRHQGSESTISGNEEGPRKYKSESETTDLEDDSSHHDSSSSTYSSDNDPSDSYTDDRETDSSEEDRKRGEKSKPATPKVGATFFNDLSNDIHPDDRETDSSGEDRRRGEKSKPTTPKVGATFSIAGEDDVTGK